MDAITAGGYGWYQPLINQTLGYLDYLLSRAGLTGYYQEPEVPAPTEREALMAIWNDRPDIKDLYDKNWGEGQYAPWRAVADWLSWTPETEVEQAGRDPIQYAISLGLIEPGKEAGEKEPTLAMRQFEEAQKEWWASFEEDQRRADREFLRQQGLDEEAIRQYEEAKEERYYRYGVVDEQWEKEYLRQIGLDEEDIRRWDLDRQDRLDAFAEDTRRWEAEQARLLNLDKEDVRRWNAMFAQEQLRDERSWQQWSDEFEFKKQAWAEELGLEREKFRFESGLAERQQEFYERMAEQGLGLDYLNLLSGLRGPQDWLRYSQAKRAAQTTELPGFAQSFLTGQPMAGFQGAAPVPAASPEGLLTWQEQLAKGLGVLPGAGAQAGQVVAEPQLQQPVSTAWNPYTVQAQQQTPADFWSLLAQNPHKVSAAQVAQMTPSEQQMLAGAVESYGGWWEDWLRGLSQSAPRGQANPWSTWRGW